MQVAQRVATTPAARREPWYSRLELATLIPGLALAALMLWSVSRSLEEANWAAGLDVLTGLTLLGLLVGVAFARTGWMPGWLANGLAGLLGVALVVQQVSGTLVAQVGKETSPAMAARLGSWSEWATEILLRALVWVRILRSGGRGEDIVLFVVTVALLMWALGYLTGWLIFRSGRSWLAIAMAGVVIMINYTFILPKPTLLFFIFLGSALLLMVYQHVTLQQRVWRSVLIEIPGLILWRSILAAAIFCGALGLVTSVLPGTVTSGEAQRAWRVLRAPFTAIRESWQDAFSTINAPPGTSGSFATRGVRVGGPRSLSDSVVMRIKSSKYEYWRAVAFDRYSGLNWQNTVGERARATLGVATAEQARSPVEANEPIVQAELTARTPVTQTVSLQQARSDGLLMVGGQFSSAGVPVLLQNGFLTDSGGNTVPNYTETSSVVAEVPLEEGGTYTITTFLSDVDEQSLRQAGTGYPQWVRAPYTQLPGTLPERVREKAREVVAKAGATTPYDQAVAIQNYLRTLTYDERRPAPPDDRDWVDYFLFDRQVGYCDDFATAMVVMLRTLDVPARWVQGYAGGTLDPDTREWVIRESVAHSWVEVYFPGYGWQRFEPTPAPYAIVPARPAAPPEKSGDRTPSTGDVSNALSDPEEILRRIRRREEDLNGESSGDLAALQALVAQREAEAQRRSLILAGTLVSALAAAGLGASMALKFQLRGLSPAAAEFARMARLAGWAGVGQEDGVTPREYAQQLGRAVPEVGGPVLAIATAYEDEQYRPDHRGAAPDPSRWRPVRQALLRRLAGRLFSAERRAGAQQRRAARAR